MFIFALQSMSIKMACRVLVARSRVVYLLRKKDTRTPLSMNPAHHDENWLDIDSINLGKQADQEFPKSPRSIPLAWRRRQPSQKYQQPHLTFKAP